MKKTLGIFILMFFVAAGYGLYALMGGDVLLAQGFRTKVAFVNTGTPAKEPQGAPVLARTSTVSAPAKKTTPASPARAADYTAAAVPSLASIFPNVSLENLPIFLDALSAILELAKEDPMVKEDLSKLMYALGHGMTAVKNPDRHNAWDTRPMSDWERVLYCLEDILKPQNKKKFKALVLKVMHAGEALEGSDIVYGMQYSLGTLYKYRDPRTNKIMDLGEIDYALYHCLMQLNAKGLPRDKDSMKVSSLQSTLMLLDAMGRMTAPLKGAPAKLAFSLMQLDPAGPDIKTRSDALEFFGGLMGKSMYYYPKSYHNTFQIGAQEYRPYPDPLKGADWFLYQQKLTLAGILPMRGMNGMLYLMKNFTVADFVLGVVTENVDALYVMTGSTGKAHSTGQGNRLLTLTAPVLNYVYDKGYTPQFMKFAAALNEIPLTSYKSTAWNRGGGTLRQANLGTALEVIQGPYGYGALYYLMRGASDARYNNEADLVDPGLDLMVRVLSKLSRTPYGKSNLLKGMYDELSKIDLSSVVQSKEDVVDKMYRENGPVDTLYRFLHDNHTQLVQLGAGWGNVMLAAANQQDKQKNLFYTSDLTGLLQQSVFPTLSREMKRNNTVVKSMAANIRKMADSDAPAAARGQVKAVR